MLLTVPGVPTNVCFLGLGVHDTPNTCNLIVLGLCMMFERLLIIIVYLPYSLLTNPSVYSSTENIPQKVGQNDLLNKSDNWAETSFGREVMNVSKKIYITVTVCLEITDCYPQGYRHPLIFHNTNFLEDV